MQIIWAQHAIDFYRLVRVRMAITLDRIIDKRYQFASMNYL